MSRTRTLLATLSILLFPVTGAPAATTVDSLISTFAGSGPSAYPGGGATFCGAPTLATQACLNYPTALVFDARGNRLLIADSNNGAIEAVDLSSRVLTIIAGRGSITGDGIPAADAALVHPAGMAIDADGNIWFAEERGSAGTRIRVIAAASPHIITTIVNDGFLWAPPRLAFLPNGDLLVPGVEYTSQVWILRKGAQHLESIAGTGYGFGGDGGPARAATFAAVACAVPDRQGNIFVCDNGNGRIRRIDAMTNVVTTVLGGGVVWNLSGNPNDVAFDADGGMYVTDSGHNQVVRLNAGGSTADLVAGTGAEGFSGNGGPAVAAQLWQPLGLAFDPGGNLYVSDSINNRVRRVDSGSDCTGLIGTVDQTKPTVVITHGFETPWSFTCGGPDWVPPMVALIKTHAPNVNVLSYVWRDAYSWGPIMYATQNGEKLGHLLANRLGDGYDKGIHLIGHSQGAAVSARAAGILANHAVGHIQVTILDSPAFDSLFRRELPAPSVMWVDNYYGLIQVPKTLGGQVPGAFNTALWTTHSGVRSWYADTIGPAATEGFYWSITGDGFGNHPAPRTWDPNAPSAFQLVAESVFFGAQSVSTWVWNTSGAALILPDGSATLTEMSPASLFASGTVPSSVRYISFDFKFTRLGDGDYLTFDFAGTPLFHFDGEAFQGAEFVNSGLIPTDALAGQTGQMAFVLNSVGAPNAQIEIANLTFYSEVPADTTAPVIAPNVSGTPGANGWYTSDVTVSWSVTDGESSITATQGCDTAQVTSDTADATFTCEATSAGGTASQSVTIKRDTTPPTVTPMVAGTLGLNGWYTSSVTVSWSVLPGHSPLASQPCAPTTITFDTPGAVVACRAISESGLSASSSVTIKRDRTPPSVAASLTPVRRGGDDESMQQFVIFFSATDAVGVTSTAASLNGITVQNGQVVNLKVIKSGAQKVNYDDGRMQIQATSFELTVIAKDAAGNAGAGSVVPVFIKHGKDSHDRDQKASR